MITPFTADGTVDFAAAEALAAHLVDHGSDTLVVCGTTGESPTLTWDEEYELFQVIQKAIAGRGQLMAGTGSNCTREAIAATQKTMKLGIAGSLQVVPYYNKPPQAALYQHFQAIATACPDMAILLYNVPGRTGQNLAPETIAQLAELPNIIGVKEASGNLDQASQIRRMTPADFAIYSGDDSLTLPLLAVGGRGVVSVASHLVGDRLQAMIQAFQSGQVQTATQIHLELLPLFKALFTTTNPIPVKAALQLQGWIVGAPRLPLVAADAAVIDTVRAAMEPLGLLQSTPAHSLS